MSFIAKMYTEDLPYHRRSVLFKFLHKELHGFESLIPHKP